jgi:hypothetical protein
MAPVGDSLTIYTLVLFGMDMVLSGIYRKGGNIDLRDVCGGADRQHVKCPGSEGGGHC